MIPFWIPKVPIATLPHYSQTAKLLTKIQYLKWVYLVTIITVVSPQTNLATFQLFNIPSTEKKSLLLQELESKYM
jgi:hypothetical protein